MRKLWMFIFVLLFCLLLLSACDSKEPETVKTEPTESTTESAAQTTSQTELDTEKVPKPSKGDKTTEPTSEPAESDSLMSSIQEKLEQDQALCAVAYVGYCGGSFAEIQAGFETEGLLEALPILAMIEEDRFISNEGSELYLVVPREDVGLTVYEQVLDENGEALTYGEELYRSAQVEPLLLRGNVSDIFPNFVLLIEGQGGETMEYSPSLSLRDGMLNVETSLISDLTPYDVLEIYTGSEYGGEDPCMGRWFAEVPDSEGEAMILELVIGYDGLASYGYGPANTELYEFFEGEWWQTEEGNLCLSLSGGPVGDPEAQYDFYGEYQTECMEYSLNLTHVDGNSLLYGMEGGTINFSTSNTNALIGLWSTSAYDFQGDGYIYHDLELMGDHYCCLLIHNGEGTTYAAYDGTWEASDGKLSFDMKMYSGNNYLDSITQTMSGIYDAVIDPEGWLTLHYFSGDYLTEDMGEIGIQTFEPTVSYG